MNIGPIPVPTALEKYVPYLKFAAALAGVVATAVVTLVAAPPAWAYIVITVVTALGVYTVPNSGVQAVLSDGLAALTGAEDAVKDAKAGNVVKAEADVHGVLADAQAAEAGGEGIVRDIDPTLLPLPPTPPAV
jgi:hypothetical protein